MKTRGEGVPKNNSKLFTFATLLLLSVGFWGVFLLKKTPQNDIQNYDLIKEEGYFVPLKLYGYSQANLPFLEVNIGNMTIPAIVDLGFQGMFSLPVDLIKKVEEKKWIENTRTFGMKGTIYENNVYEVENIEIQSMSFPFVKVQESCQKSLDDGALGTPPKTYCFGALGWELFSEYNLLVDCRQYLLALCDSVKTLKQQCYPVDAFTEVPMIVDSKFLIIDAITDKGALRCLLDTGSTWNLLNKNMENEFKNNQISDEYFEEQNLVNLEDDDSLFFNPEDTQEYSSFKMGDKEFGPMTFRRFKSPVEIDAILGMEFFDTHLVFIDFANSKVYIAPYPKEMWPKQNLRLTIGRLRFYHL